MMADASTFLPFSGCSQIIYGPKLIMMPCMAQQSTEKEWLSAVCKAAFGLSSHHWSRHPSDSCQSVST